MKITINKNWRDRKHLNLIEQSASALNAAGIIDDETYSSITAELNECYDDLEDDPN